MGSDCKICAARAQGLCADLTTSELVAVDALKAPAQFVKARGTLFTQGEVRDRVLSVRSGWAMIYTLLEDGRRQILRFALPGSLLGFQVGPAGSMIGTAEALTDVTVCSMSRRDLLRTCERVPRLAVRLATMMAADSAAAWDQVSALGQRSARERIAKLLLDLYCRAHGPRRDGWAAIDLPLNQTHIADATGLTPVHVCRTLKQMRIDGLLEFHRGQLRLIDPERLAEVAEMDLEAMMPPMVSPRLMLRVVAG